MLLRDVADLKRLRQEDGHATGNDRNVKRPGLKVFNPFKELA